MALPIHFPGNLEEHATGSELTPYALRSVAIDLSCKLPSSELTKLYRMIETALPDKPNRVIQFASAYEAEGAGEIAFEMAVVAAQIIGKRVLYLDTSGGAPAAPSNKLPEDMGDSLTTLLLTGRPPHEAIAQAAGTELYFAMLRQQDEGDLYGISLATMEKALHYLQAGFDLIILDSQSIMKSAFGMALAKLVDGTILVVEAERTRAPVAAECRNMLEAGGGRVIGSILNKRRFYIPKFLYRLLYRHATV